MISRNRLLTNGVLRFFLLNSVLALLLSSASAFGGDSDHHYSDNKIRGIWTYSGWVEATLLVPVPGQITHAASPPSIFNPGDRVSVKGTLVGLFKFDGRGKIDSFHDLFKAGGIEPFSPPFPLPFLPPFPEQGNGSYTVNPDGTVKLSTVIINPGDGAVAGEADYDCVLNLSPKQLDCIFSRFKTYVVDPNGFEAPIVGLVTLRPQR